MLTDEAVGSVWWEGLESPSDCFIFLCFEKVYDFNHLTIGVDARKLLLESFDILVTLRFLCLKERNINLVAISAVI